MITIFMANNTPTLEPTFPATEAVVKKLDPVAGLDKNFVVAMKGRKVYKNTAK